MAITAPPLGASVVYRSKTWIDHAAIVVRDYGDSTYDLYVILPYADGAEYKRKVPQADSATPGSFTYSGTGVASGAETAGPLGLYTTNWQKALGKAQSGTAGAHATLACIGDSWTANDRIYGPVRRFQQSLYGNAGAGYISLTSRNSVSEITVTTTGTWTETDGVSASAGLDVSDTTSSDTATPARKSLTASVTTFVVHYLTKSGGGKFTWSLDGGAETTIDTAAASSIYATVSITAGATSQSHTLSLKITVAGSAGVTLMGVECNKNDVVGVRMHRLGNGGKQASWWSQVCTLWQSGFPLIAPDLTFIMFGVNEKAQNVSLATFQQNLINLAGIVKSLVPTTDIIMVAPSDTGQTPTTYTSQQYADAMQAAAISAGTGFISAMPVIGPYPAANAAGLYADINHLSAAGGQVVANLINPALISGPGSGSSGISNDLRVQLFTASTTWVIPTGINWVRIDCVAGGGGGGAGSTSTSINNAVGGGGGGAGCNTTNSVKVATGDSLSISVGAAGAGGIAGGANATAGGNSYILRLGLGLCLARGGGAGVAAGANSATVVQGGGYVNLPPTLQNWIGIGGSSGLGSGPEYGMSGCGGGGGGAANATNGGGGGQSAGRASSAGYSPPGATGGSPDVNGVKGGDAPVNSGGGGGGGGGSAQTGTGGGGGNGGSGYVVITALG